MVAHSRRWSLRKILLGLAGGIVLCIAVLAAFLAILSATFGEMFPVVETDSSRWPSPSGDHCVEAVILDAGATTAWALSLTMTSESWWRWDTSFFSMGRYLSPDIGISVRWKSDDEVIIHLHRDIAPERLSVHGVEVDLRP